MWPPIECIHQSNQKCSDPFHRQLCGDCPASPVKHYLDVTNIQSLFCLSLQGDFCLSVGSSAYPYEWQSIHPYIDYSKNPSVLLFDLSVQVYVRVSVNLYNFSSVCVTIFMLPLTVNMFLCCLFISHICLVVHRSVCLSMCLSIHLFCHSVCLSVDEIWTHSDLICWTDQDFAIFQSPWE